MNEVTPITIKPEPDWSEYRSYDNPGTQNASNTNYPAVTSSTQGLEQNPHSIVTTKTEMAGPQMNGVNSMTYGNMSGQPSPMNAFDMMQSNAVPQAKKRGRKKKVKNEPETTVDGIPIKQEKITDTVKVRKKPDRFKGMTEAEVLQRVLPDIIAPNLDILIIGINPGLTAAFIGHYFAGPGNHFWKCLFLSGLIPEQMNAYDDRKLLQYGIGFTNIVERTSRGSADLSKKEIQEGGEILRGKVQMYKPKIAVFNGKGIYEVFCGHKKFSIGKQPDHFPDCEGTAVFVMPSSSARFTQLPRAIDKVPFYLALKKFRDYLKGNLAELDEEEISFPDLNLKVVPKAERLAKEKAEAEANGQFWPVKQENLSDGETKPKRGRKKKSKEPDEVQTFNVMNQSGQAMVKQEPGLAFTTGQCVGSPTMVTSSQAGFGSQQHQVSSLAMPMTSAGMIPSATSSCGPNLDQMLQDGSTLVKQEDLTELSQFGIDPQQLQAHYSSMHPVTTYSGGGVYNTHTDYISQMTPRTQGEAFWPPMCTATAAMFADQGQLPHHSHYAMAAYNQGFSRHMGPVTNANDYLLGQQSNLTGLQSSQSVMGQAQNVDLQSSVQQGNSVSNSTLSQNNMTYTMANNGSFLHNHSTSPIIQPSIPQIYPSSHNALEASSVNSNFLPQTQPNSIGNSSPPSSITPSTNNSPQLSNQNPEDVKGTNSHPHWSQVS